MLSGPKADTKANANPKTSPNRLSALPNDALDLIAESLSEVDVSKGATTARFFQERLTNRHYEIYIKAGREILSEQKDLSPTLKELFKTEEGLLALGKKLITLEDAKRQLEKDSKPVDKTDLRVLDHHKPEDGKEIRDNRRILKLLLSPNGIKALESKHIPSDILRREFNRNSTQFFMRLKRLLTNNGLKGLNEKLFTYNEFMESEHDTLNCETLLTTQGLAALRDGLFTFQDCSRVVHLNYIIGLPDVTGHSNPNGLIALRERLYTIQDLSKADKYDIMDMLSSEAIANRREEIRARNPSL